MIFGILKLDNYYLVFMFLKQCKQAVIFMVFFLVLAPLVFAQETGEPNIVVKDIDIDPATRKVMVTVENIGETLKYQKTMWIKAKDLDSGREFMGMLVSLGSGEERTYTLTDNRFLNVDYEEVEEKESGVYNMKAWVEDSMIQKVVTLGEASIRDLEVLNVTVPEESITESSVKITWQTNVAATSKVRVNIITNGDWTEFDAVDNGTEHFIVLENLEPSKKYTYYIKTEASDEMTAQSTYRNFLTKTPAGTPQADLTIKEVGFVPEPPKRNEIYNGQVKVRVANIGEIGTESEYGINVVLHLWGGVTGGDSKSIENLKANEERDVYFDLKYKKFDEDILEISAWIDSNSMAKDGLPVNDDLRVRESNEDNNTYYREIKLEDGEGGAVNLLEDEIWIRIDRIALNADEIPAGFKLDSFKYHDSESLAADQSAYAPIEYVTQVYRIGDRPVYTVYYRNFKNIGESSVSYGKNDNMYEKNAIELEEGEKFIDSLKCREEPVYKYFRYYCKFYYDTFYIENQVTLLEEGYQEPLQQMKKIYENIVNYDSSRIPPIPNLTDREIEEAISVFAIKNKQVYGRLKGKIMIKVEDKGKAYYIHPDKGEMFYLGRPDDAFQVMRNQGIGISNTNLHKIPVGINSEGPDSDGDGLSDYLEETLGLNKDKVDSDGDGYSDKNELEAGFSPWGQGRQNLDQNFSSNQKGKIFLQVEGRGEAWYVNPEDGKRYFLGRPADAFAVMRNLGLGISNSDFDSLD